MTVPVIPPPTTPPFAPITLLRNVADAVAASFPEWSAISAFSALQ
jgi:hypothetical protein